MKYDWIIDVLTDLKSFAQANGLPALAEQLDDTSLLAATEIAQRVAIVPGEAGLHADAVGVFSGEIATGGNA